MEDDEDGIMNRMEIRSHAGDQAGICRHLGKMIGRWPLLGQISSRRRICSYFLVQCDDATVFLIKSRCGDGFAHPRRFGTMTPELLATRAGCDHRDFLFRVIDDELQYAESCTTLTMEKKHHTMVKTQELHTTNGLHDKTKPALG